MLNLSKNEMHSIVDISYTNEILCKKLYEITKSINETYPAHYNWFHETFMKKLKNKKALIIYTNPEGEPYSPNGIIFIDLEKNKICTLFIEQQSRGKGLATMLMEEATKQLIKPTLTVSYTNIDKLLPILKKFDFLPGYAVKGYYEPESVEIVFNDTSGKVFGQEILPESFVGGENKTFDIKVREDKPIQKLTVPYYETMPDFTYSKTHKTHLRPILRIE